MESSLDGSLSVHLDIWVMHQDSLKNIQTFSLELTKWKTTGECSVGASGFISADSSNVLLVTAQTPSVMVQVITITQGRKQQVFLYQLGVIPPGLPPVHQRAGRKDQIKHACKPENNGQVKNYRSHSFPARGSKPETGVICFSAQVLRRLTFFLCSQIQSVREKESSEKELMGKCLHRALNDRVLWPLHCSFMHMIYVYLQWRRTCTKPSTWVRGRPPLLPSN